MSRSTADWLTEARAHAPALRSLIVVYHPSAVRERDPLPIGRITAPAAEAACAEVRREIAVTEPGDPVARFDAALTVGNVNELLTLLNGAWFGVPESTACWGVSGFSEAVALLEDPPDEDEPAV